MEYRKDEEVKNSKKFYGGNFRFLTDLNHQLIILAASCHLFGKWLKMKNIKLLGSFLQGCVVFPNSLFVACE